MEYLGIIALVLVSLFFGYIAGQGDAHRAQRKAAGLPASPRRARKNAARARRA